MRCSEFAVQYSTVCACDHSPNNREILHALVNNATGDVATNKYL